MTMVDLDDMLMSLSDMRDYFETCAANAREGGRMQKTYKRYITTLCDVMEIVRTKRDEEDDGK